MKRIIPSLLLLIGLAVPAAFADNITLVSVSGYKSASGSVYTSPYTLSDSGILGGADISVFCDSYNNSVTIGETWQGTTNAFSANGQISGGLYGSSPTAEANYDEAVILYSQFLAGPLNSATSNAYSYAIWDLLTPGATANNFVSDFNASGAAALLAAYNPSEAATFNFTGWDLITPASGDAGKNAQEYIYMDVATPTPEPGSLALFGGGLIGVGFALRRKLLKKGVAISAALFLMFVFTGAARADGIINGDFSAPVTLDQFDSTGSWESGVVPGWVVVGDTGVYLPSASIYGSLPGASATIAYSNSGSLSQDVGALQANTVYEFEIYVGQRLDELQTTYSISLTDGSDVLASLTGSNADITPGTFALETLSFTTSSDVTGDLTITLADTGGEQIDWADDSLTASPEIPTAILFGSGLFGLMGLLHRKLLSRWAS